VRLRLRRFDDAEALAVAAADEIAARIDAGLAAAPRFTLVLAGGETPRRTYALLADRHGPSVDWDRVHVFWGDERCVPPDDPDSNYAMARAALLDRVGVPAANVHRMRAEIDPPALAAEEHERELRAFFAREGPSGFDLVLLGVGEDGHTGSLFPEDPALRETSRFVVAVRSAVKPPPWRITLTLPALCASQDALFLVAGAKKRAIVEAAAKDLESAAERFPAAAVRPRRRLDWFVDAAAAGAANDQPEG
jgi:6-phosphogluconolactonase